MIKINETLITSQNKELLGQDFSGYTMQAQINNLQEFMEKYGLNNKDEICRKWEGVGEEKFIRIEILDKISENLFDPNTYEAIVFEEDGGVKHWSTIIIDKGEHFSTEYSPKASIRFFGLWEIDIDKIGDLCHIQIYKSHREETLTSIKTSFELCDDAKLYHALKKRKYITRQLESKLELYETWKKTIDDVKEHELSTYSEITYWKELEIKSLIKDIRVQLYGPFAYIDLEIYWYEELKFRIEKKEFEAAEVAWISVKTRKSADPQTLKCGDIVVKVHRQDESFWLYLIKLEKGSSFSPTDKEKALDYDEEKTIDSFCVDLNQKRFYYKRKSTN